MKQTRVFLALHIKWFGPSDRRPSRWRVKTGAGAKWYAKDFSGNTESEVRRVAEQYMRDKGWEADLYIGQLPNGDWCAVQVKED